MGGRTVPIVSEQMNGKFPEHGISITATLCFLRLTCGHRHGGVGLEPNTPSGRLRDTRPVNE